MRAGRLLGVVGLAVSILLAGGCGDDKEKKSGDEKATASPVSASAELTSAVEALSKATYKYTIKMTDVTGSGAVDAQANQATFTLSIMDEGDEFRSEVVILGQELYLKISGLPLPGLDGSKWYQVDRSKAKSLSSLGIENVDDPIGAKSLAQTFVTVEKTGDRAFKGTLDLTKGGETWGIDKEGAAELGDKAKAIPFQATTTAQGQLASLKMTIPAYGGDPETAIDVTFTDHGAKLDLKKPPSNEVVKAPDSIYDMLEG